MKELILIRHGEAEHLVGEKTGGWTDTHLTERGREEALATGRALAGLLEGRAFRFYSSDLARARETAEGIATALCVDPTLSPELRELNNGEAANRTKQEARSIELPMTHPPYDWIPYPGAESWRMMVNRIYGFLDRIMKDPEDVSLFVAHGNAGVAIVHWWLRLGEEGWSHISFDFAPCSVTHLTVNKWGDRTISRLNDTRHLIPLESRPKPLALG